MLKIVISQPMYFPWVGMFEQIRLCDIYIHYDDVQFSKGSFTNRVQIKAATSEGFKWLTVPLKNLKLGQKINEVEIDYSKDWRVQHLELLKNSYKGAPYMEDMLKIISQLFTNRYDCISELSKKSIELVINYYDLKLQDKIFTSSELPVYGSSSQRVLDLVNLFKGDIYITGHGAKNYLDHELFEKEGVAVEYMHYLKKPYQQLNGNFNPYVSILDLIANTGKEGLQFIISSTKSWRQFLYESNRQI
jgi:WbqC-like protein family